MNTRLCTIELSVKDYTTKESGTFSYNGEVVVIDEGLKQYDFRFYNTDSGTLAVSIDNSKEVAEKISSTADKLVDKGLKAQENKADAQVILSEDETIEADFKKNEKEYLYHGIDHKVDKQWKRTLLLRINDVWFVVWAIVSCFTIVPVSTFLSRIKALKGLVKGVAIVIGILLMLGCLGGLTYALLKWCGVFG